MKTKSAGLLDAIKVPINPFPGLRPFEYHESDLFFGRDGLSEQLMKRLAATRFLAVVGTSGSGKSSLVRAGLLPALKGGFMADAGSSWRIALIRPGNDPIGNLARALNEREVFGSDDPENTSLQVAITEATLRLGTRGLVEAVRQNAMPQTENLLVIVDQFEELFRFAHEIGNKKEERTRYRDEAAAFVKLLLEARRQCETNIYVVLTMRSDFLGDCSQFWDLPEAINEGQYLIPRLTRDQLREAITGPLAVAGGDITPPVVNRLLNNIGDNQDQLPVLQHALMRMWDEWKELRLEIEFKEGEGTIRRPHREVHKADAIDLCCYEAVGGMAEALSRHADEAYNELPDERSRKTAEIIFKRLTEKGEDNREIRRPATLGELRAVAEADEGEVIAVVEKFRAPGRSFLMPPAGTLLNAESLIDISHESLIRVWKRLDKWVGEEAESARMYRRLAETAALYRKDRAGLWGDPDLQLALNWSEENRPNQEWANRYDPAFEQAMSFLEASRHAREKEQRRRRSLVAILAAACLIFAALAIFAFRQRQRAEDQSQRNRQLYYVANMNLAHKAFEEGRADRGYDLLNAFLPVSGKNDEDVRGFDWYYRWREYHQGRRTLSGHAGAIYAVAFAPDGRTLASASDDDTVKLWDVASGQELATLKGHADNVYAVAFAPDGRTLASASYGGTVKLWDVASRRELATLEGHVLTVWSVAFAPDGRTLASASFDDTVRLWDVASRRELATLKGHADTVRSVAFAPDGRTLASASGDDTVRLWDVASRRELATLGGHADNVWSVAFAPDGRTLASASDDKTIRLWEVASRQEPATLGDHIGTVYAVAFAPDGRTLASASGDDTVRLWDVASRRELATLKGHGGNVHAVAFAPDGRTLASASGDGTVKLWDVASRRESATLGGHADTVYAVAFAPDGRTLASASGDGTVKLWDVASRQESATLGDHIGTVYAVAFAPDGRTLASASFDDTVKLWDVASRRESATLGGHADTVRSVAFAPDGRTLASASGDKTIRLWLGATDEEVEAQRSR